jgi:hypothetical protein
MTMTSHDYDLEANLQIDYSYLEASRCLCGKEKEVGALFCRGCFEFMPVDELAILQAMKPGEGIAIQAARTHAKLERSKRKGW